MLLYFYLQENINKNFNNSSINRSDIHHSDD